MTTDGPALPAPFRIGVRPLRGAPWLRLDGELERLRARKRELYAGAPREVFRRAADARLRPVAERAASETLTLVRDALREAGSVPTGDADAPDLVRAALDIAEDLVILVRDADGWRLAEGFVAAPSAWRLAEKVGRPLGEVHGPVPGFAAGTGADAMITRMLDALRPGEPVVRGSWSLHADGRRFLPRHAPGHEERLADALRSRSGGGPFDGLHLRSERQVLRRLPASGATLFSIDTTIRPAASIAAGERIALVAQLGAMTSAQRAYRGLPSAGPSGDRGDA